MRLALSFDPLLPLPVIGALAVALALVIAVLAVRRLRGTVVRALVSVLLVLALLNPVLQREEREPLPGIVALVVDDSSSQRLGERREQTEAALQQVRERIAALGHFEVREVRAGDSPRGNGTELFADMAQVIDDVPAEQLAGAILITDGQVHDVPDDAGQLGFNAPIHALITGHEDEHDRRIELHRAPRFAILGQPQTLTYRVIDPTLPQGARVAVEMRINGEVVSTDQVQVGNTQTVELPIRHAGKVIAELEVEESPGELALENNVAVAEIDVLRENLRVLLVSGEPHSGERTWRDVLKSDAAVDLVHFTILRPPEKQDGTPINELSLIAFPTRELFQEKIDEFDLIIFDRYQRRGVLPILYYDNVARYVRDGGAVLVASGPEYASNMSIYRTPLGSVLPATPTGAVIEEPYRAALTEAGARHPVTRNLPGSEAEPPGWSSWFRLVEADVFAGDIAMHGPGERPLLVLSREQEGRVALLLSDHAWLWARNYDGGGPHGVLLRRIIHWLMQEPELEEEALRARGMGGDLIVERQTLAESAQPVRLTGPAGKETTLELAEEEPGLWRATLEDAPLGLYRAEDGEFTALAHVGPANPVEFQEVVSTTERLAPLSHATGGETLRLGPAASPNVPRILDVAARAPAAGSGWIGLRRSEASVLKSVDRLPLFSGILGLALLVGGFALLWYREGR
jgi:hypothetical protein